MPRDGRGVKGGLCSEAEMDDEWRKRGTTEWERQEAEEGGSTCSERVSRRPVVDLIGIDFVVLVSN